MKSTFNWIKSHVPDFEGSVEEMCDAFTMSGTEVEWFRPVGDDFLIEFAVTSNRVDCLGMIGLARELAAVKGLAVRSDDADVPKSSDAVESSGCSVAIADTNACPRYTAMIIEGVKVGPSPDWMVKRLEAIGLRSVNNIVDATNYVLFERNQPFHAFDLDRLEGGGINVRAGAKGESITAINEKVYELNDTMTVITSGNRPVAIAGVMGGADTEVSKSTTRVLLETAAFEPLAVRRTSKDLNLTSDSSFRFERGLDPVGVPAAAARCAALVAEVAGGAVVDGIIDAGQDLSPRDPISFRISEVKRICGIDVEANQIVEIFNALGFGVEEGEEGSLQVTPATWRNDLYREIDLVEEVIRIHGLHHIPVETEMRVMTPATNRSEVVGRTLKNRLVGLGYSETLTTSFVSNKDGGLSLFSTTEPVTVENAVRSNESVLRQSLIPSLLTAAKTNQDHGSASVNLMECTVLYFPVDGDAIPEHFGVVGLLTGGDYRFARGSIEEVFASLGIQSGVSFRSLGSGTCKGLLDADGGAEVLVGDEVVGYVGRPTTELTGRFDLNDRPYVAELRMDYLLEHANLVPQYTPLSRFPAVTRDLAVVCDEATSWGDLESCILGLDLPHLESLSFFDLYRGKQVEKGRKSLAFALSYRSSDRTLTGNEVDASQQTLIAQLESTFGATVR